MSATHDTSPVEADRGWADSGAGLLLSVNVQVDRWHLERSGNVVLLQLIEGLADGYDSDLDGGSSRAQGRNVRGPPYSPKGEAGQQRDRSGEHRTEPTRRVGPPAEVVHAPSLRSQSEVKGRAMTRIRSSPEPPLVA